MLTEDYVKRAITLLAAKLKNDKGTPSLLTGSLLYLPCKPWGRLMRRTLGIDFSQVIEYLHKKGCVESQSHVYSIKGHIYKNYVLRWDKVSELVGVQLKAG